MPPAAHSSSIELQLALVTHELVSIGELLHDAAVVARALSAQADWQARSAAVFRERSAAWAGDVAGLGCLVETARLAASRACDRAAERAAAEGGW